MTVPGEVSLAIILASFLFRTRWKTSCYTNTAYKVPEKISKANQEVGEDSVLEIHWWNKSKLNWWMLTQYSFLFFRVQTVSRDYLCHDTFWRLKRDAKKVKQFFSSWVVISNPTLQCIKYMFCQKWIGIENVSIQNWATIKT